MQLIKQLWWVITESFNQTWSPDFNEPHHLTTMWAFLRTHLPIRHRNQNAHQPLPTTRRNGNEPLWWWGRWGSRGGWARRRAHSPFLPRAPARIRCQRDHRAFDPGIGCYEMGKAARRSVTSSVEAACDGWREDRDRSPPSAPRRRASPARRATAAAARRGMVARVVGFWTLGEWKENVRPVGGSECRAWWEETLWTSGERNQFICSFQRPILWIH